MGYCRGMTNSKAPKSLSQRIVLGVVGLGVCVFGAYQFMHGMSTLRGRKPDFAAVAQKSLAGTKDFTSGDGDFALKYPASWDESPVPNFKFHAQTLSGLVNVNVGSEPVPASATLASYLGATLASIDKTGIKIHGQPERTELTVGGVPAVHLAMVATMPPEMHVDTDLHFDQLVTVHDGKGYVMTFTTEVGAAAVMAPVFLTTMNSFHFTK